MDFSKIRSLLDHPLFEGVDASSALVAADVRGEAEALVVETSDVCLVLKQSLDSLKEAVRYLINDAEAADKDCFWELLREEIPSGSGTLLSALVRLCVHSMRGVTAHPDAAISEAANGDAGVESVWNTGVLGASVYLWLAQAPGARSYDVLHEGALILACTVLETTARALSKGTGRKRSMGDASVNVECIEALGEMSRALQGALQWCSLVMHDEARRSSNDAVASAIAAVGSQAPGKKTRAVVERTTTSLQVCALEAMHPRHGDALTLARKLLRCLKPVASGTHEFLSTVAPSSLRSAQWAAVQVALAAVDAQAPWCSKDAAATLVPSTAEPLFQQSQDTEEAPESDEAAPHEDDEDDEDDGDGDDDLPVWREWDVSPIPLTTALSRLPAALALAEHIVAGAADSTVARRQAARAAALISTRLPHKHRRAFVAFLKRLSRCSSVPRRIAACDTISALLKIAPSGAGAAGASGVERSVWTDEAEPSSAEAAAQAALAMRSAAERVNEEYFFAPEAAGLLSPAAVSPHASRRRTIGAPRARVASPGAALTPAATAQSSRKSIGGASTVLESAQSTEAVEALAASLGDGTSAAFLVDVLIRRCSDRAALVRCRALGVCSELLSDKGVFSRTESSLAPGLTYRALFAILAQCAARSMGREAAVVAAQEAGATATAAKLVSSVTDASFLLNGGLADGAASDDPAPLSPLLPLFLRRMQDERPAVRKVAASGLAFLGTSGGYCAAGREDDEDEEEPEEEPRQDYSDSDSDSEPGDTPTAGGRFVSTSQAGRTRGRKWMNLPALMEDVTVNAKGRAQPPSSVLGVYAMQALAAACADESVSVRKTALNCMSALLVAEPGTSAVVQLWLACAPPMVEDAEATVSKTAVDAVVTHILTPIATLGAKAKYADSEVVAESKRHSVWLLLGSLATHPDLITCLRKAVTIAADNKAVDLVVTSRGLWNVACDMPVTTGAAVSRQAWAVSAGAWVLLDAIVRTLSGTGVAQPSSTVNVGGAVAKSLFRAGVSGEAVSSAWEDIESFLSDVQAGTGAVATCEEAERQQLLAQCAGVAQVVLSVLAQVSGSLIVADGAGKGRTLRVKADDLSKLEDTAKRAGKMCSKLVKSCLRFAWPAQLSAAAVEAMGQLSRAAVLVAVTRAALDAGGPVEGSLVLVSEEELDSAAAQLWCPALFSACEAGLSSFVVSSAGGSTAGLPTSPAAREEAVTRRIFLAGQVSLWGLDVNTEGQREDSSSSSSSKKKRRSDKDGEHAGGVTVPEKLTGLIQTLAAPYLPGSDPRTETPPLLRAHAFTALGKLCLRSPSVAKTCIAAFVKELTAGSASCRGARDPSSPAARNNALFALSDLCVRYTALVDAHLPAIAAACADEHPVVRRHAVLLISQLLQSEYVKWRPVLFHRFVAAMADPVEAVRQTAAAALTGPLQEKNPNLIPGMFVEAMFVLSGCTAHPDLNREGRAVEALSPAPVASAVLSAADWRGRFDTQDPRTLALLGPGSRKQRLAVWKTLLQAVNDEGKLKIVSKLLSDVIAAVPDGMMKLPPRTAIGRSAVAARAVATPQSVVSSSSSNNSVGSPLPDGEQAPAGAEAIVGEALELLSSEECRFKGAAAAASADTAPAEETAPESSAQAVAAATKRVLAGVAKKLILESAVPAVVALRAELAQARSPVSAQVLHWLCTTVSQYGEGSVKEALASDPTLADEVAYDVRRINKARLAAEKRRKQSIASAKAEAIKEMEQVARRRSVSAVSPRPDLDQAMSASPPQSAKGVTFGEGVVSPTQSKLAPHPTPGVALRETLPPPSGSAVKLLPSVERARAAEDLVQVSSGFQAAMLKAAIAEGDSDSEDEGAGVVRLDAPAVGALQPARMWNVEPDALEDAKKQERPATAHEERAVPGSKALAPRASRAAKRAKVSAE
jgi:hypothetical protein